MRLTEAMALTAGAMPQWGIALLIVLFVVVSIMMILVVLIQKPQGGGLSGAFGASADGAGQTAFGAKTGDVLTVVTVAIFLVFLVVSIALNLSITEPVPPTDEATLEQPEDEEETPEPETGLIVDDEALGGETEAPADEQPEEGADEPAPDETDGAQDAPTGGDEDGTDGAGVGGDGSEGR